MRALLIGILIVVVVHSLLTLGSRVPPQQLGHVGRVLARLGIILGMFLPRVRMMAIYLAAMWPFLQTQMDRKSQTQAGRASSGKMSVAEAREVLGVSADATRADINKAWRELLKKHHPDQGGSADYTRRLNEARKVLLEQAR